MNQNQPNQFTVNVVNHGEPTRNQPQSARVYFDVGPNQRVNFDLTNLADTQDFIEIQTIYIDNSQCDGECIIEIPDTQQRIVAKANTQGYYPILSFHRLKFSAMHTGSKKVDIPIFLLNFIVSQGAW